MTARKLQPHVMDTDSGLLELEGELGAEAQARAEAHLASCPACRAALAEWRQVQAGLVAYAPPQEAPGAERAFWRRLAPQLPERSSQAADPAPCLAPAALALGYALWQALAVVLTVGALASRWPAVGAAWQQLASGPSALLAEAIRASWWGSSLATAASWLGAAVPAGWGSILGGLAVIATGWWMLALLAIPYAAWMLLWLRQPRPVVVRVGI